jgi:DNA-binding transcriptional MerR regulator
VTFIKRNQELGFTLEQVQQLLDLHRTVAAMTFPLSHKSGELRTIIRIGRERLDAINRRVRTLQAMRRQLTSLLHKLEAATIAVCPVSKSTGRVVRNVPQRSS